MDTKTKALVDAANAVTGAWGDGGNDKRMAPLILRLNNAVKAVEQQCDSKPKLTTCPDCPEPGTGPGACYCD